MSGQALSLSDIRPGDKLTWVHVPRGGYCIPYRVDAEVVRVGRVRVRIRVKRVRPNPGMVERSVLPKSLRRPPTPHTETAE